MKAVSAKEVRVFTDIPNVGPAMAADFKLLGITSPVDLASKDAFTLYTKLSKITGARQDPCVLDTFLAVVDFMNGAPAHPWWRYSAKRKKNYPKI